MGRGEDREEGSEGGREREKGSGIDEVSLPPENVVKRQEMKCPSCLIPWQPYMYV